MEPALWGQEASEAWVPVRLGTLDVRTRTNASLVVAREEACVWSVGRALRSRVAAP